MRLISIILIVFVTISISGCSDFFYSDVELKNLPDQNPKIVVQSYISPENDTLKVRLSKSVPYYNNSNNLDVPELISNGEVTLTCKGMEYKLNYDSISAIYQIFAGLLKIAPGDVVELRASAPGMETVTAQTTVPSGAISEAYFSHSDTVENEYPPIRIICYFRDIKGSRNEYIANLEMTLVHYLSSDTSHHGLSTFNVLSDLEQDGELIRLEFGSATDYGPMWIFPEANLQILNIDPHMASYIQSIRNLQKYDMGNPFAEPVFLYTNIKNGLGIFGSFSRYSTKVELYKK